MQFYHVFTYLKSSFYFDNKIALLAKSVFIAKQDSGKQQAWRANKNDAGLQKAKWRAQDCSVSRKVEVYGAAAKDHIWEGCEDRTAL